MSLSLKKFARSASMFAPKLRDKRVDLQIAAIDVFRRPWRPDVAAVAGFIGETPLIVDIGASRGLSVASIKMMKPNSRIVAFEPLPALARALERRYRRAPQVEVHNCALADASSKMEIFTPIYRNCVMDTLASLDYRVAADWINSDRFYWFEKDRLRIISEIVDVSRLDSFDLRPDIIKIYAQGFESAIISGGEATIRRDEPAILVPAQIPRIDQCLRDLGYSRYAFRRAKFIANGEGSYSSWYLRPKHRSQFNFDFDGH